MTKSPAMTFSEYIYYGNHNPIITIIIIYIFNTCQSGLASFILLLLPVWMLSTTAFKSFGLKDTLFCVASFGLKHRNTRHAKKNKFRVNFDDSMLCDHFVGACCYFGAITVWITYTFLLIIMPITEEDNKLRTILPDIQWPISVMIAIFIGTFTIILITLSVLFVYYAIFPHTND